MSLLPELLEKSLFSLCQEGKIISQQINSGKDICNTTYYGNLGEKCILLVFAHKQIGMVSTNCNKYSQCFQRYFDHSQWEVNFFSPLDQIHYSGSRITQANTLIPEQRCAYVSRQQSKCSSHKSFCFVFMKWEKFNGSEECSIFLRTLRCWSYYLTNDFHLVYFNTVRPGKLRQRDLLNCPESQKSVSYQHQKS